MQLLRVHIQENVLSPRVHIQENVLSPSPKFS